MSPPADNLDRLTDADLERALVAGCLRDIGALAKAADLVRPADFREPDCRAIFSALLSMHEGDVPRDGETVETLTLKQSMTAAGTWGILGDNPVGRLAELVEHACSGASVEMHARDLRRLADARRLAATCIDTARALTESADWRRNGHFEALAERIRTAATPTGPAQSGGAVLVNLADVQAEVVRWLWPGRIPLGKLTLLAGDPGLGKSFITLDIAARVSRGDCWPDSDEQAAPGGVVLLSAEDGPADTIRPRLDACGADCGRIAVLQAVRTGNGERSFDLSTDLPALAAAIRQTPRCRLVVIDPISAYLGGIDSHENAAVRALLAPLSALAAEHGVAVLGVNHLRKTGGPAVYRGMGSLAFAAAARAVYGVCRDKADPIHGRRLFLPIKANLAPDLGGLAYELHLGPMCRVPIVRWLGAVDTTADEAMDSYSKRTPGPDAREREEAAEWLRMRLTGGPLPVTEIRRLAAADGLTWPTVRRAKSELGIDAHKQGFDGGWIWGLPAEGAHVLARIAEGAQVAP